MVVMVMNEIEFRQFARRIRHRFYVGNTYVCPNVRDVLLPSIVEALNSSCEVFLNGYRLLKCSECGFYSTIGNFRSYDLKLNSGICFECAIARFVSPFSKQ